MTTRRIRVVLISSNRFVTKFMQHCDVFEPFKVEAQTTVLKMTILPEANLQKIVDHVKSLTEQEGRDVVAVFVQGTSIGYVNPDVKVVSSGENFCLLSDMLEMYDFIKETEYVAEQVSS